MSPGRVAYFVETIPWRVATGLAIKSEEWPFFAIAAKHCRQAEHTLQLDAGSSKVNWFVTSVNVFEWF
jgi:hypothetical protein